jgi:RNA polymerase sigma factor (sigma-70 family)
MTDSDPNPFVHPLRHLIGGISAAALSDGELLERFLTNRDETAVEVLVRRYGRLVLGVCRRVLHNDHTAEDAFQATFLILMRRAPSLDRDRPLGSFLYTVAYRVALRARANEQRRQRCEELAARHRSQTAAQTTTPSDLVVALEEELHRLPEKHRAALVLCYLEGKTNEQAAHLLGCPRGSMAARLDQAREGLREVLAQRGFVAPAAALAAALASVAQAAVPLPLVDSTVRAVLWVARGDASGATAVSAGALALARRTIRATVLSRIKVAGALLLAVAMLATGATMLLQAGPQAGPLAEQQTRPAESREAASDQRGNAVQSYNQAFIALRRGFKPVGEKKLRQECLTMPLNAEAREVVTRAAYALRMMHRGAALRRCDWGIDLERGIELSFTPGDAAQALSSLACVRARFRFEEGKTTEAIDDVLAALALARHVSRDGTLDSLWAGADIEQRIGELLALHLRKLDDRTLRDLKKRLDALPAGGSVARATLRMEENLLNWIVGEVKEAKDPEALLAFLSQVCGDKGQPPEKRRAVGRAFLDECGGTAKGVLQYAQEMHRSTEQRAKKLDLPPGQVQKEWDREVKKLAGNPVFQLFAPVLHNIRWRQAQMDIRRALLLAAVAVVLDGKDALKKHPDPVAGGAFEYVAFEGGFELRSGWKLDKRFDQRVVLTVGRRGKS